MSELNERLIIASLKSAEQIINISNKRVRADDFLFHQPEFNFVIEYFRRYKSTPSAATLQEQFKDWEQPGADDEGFDYYVDQLKRSSLERRLTELIDQHIPEIKSDPLSAAKNLSAKFSHLLSSSESDVAYTDRDAMRRLEDYEQRRRIRQSGKVSGIPTGLQYFNEKGAGFEYGDLVSIVGNTYIGKSWILLYMAAKAYISGHRVLLISCEMPRQSIEPRVDTIIANARMQRLPYNSLRYGDGDIAAQYTEHLKFLAQSSNWITADASDLENFDINDIVAYTDKYKPDIVCIDGLEFLQDKSTNRNRAGWEEVKAIIRQAKLFAVSRNVVVLCTAQARRTEDDRMPTKKDIAYSYDIVRASDCVIALAKGSDDNEDEEKIRYYTVQKERNGEGLTKRMKLLFDPGGGFIGEIQENEVQRSEFEFIEDIERVGS